MIFLCSLVALKCNCLAFLEKRKGETAWTVAFINSCRLLRVRCVVIPLRIACVQKSPISFVGRGKVTFPREATERGDLCMQDIREWFAPLCLGNFGKYRLLFEVMPIVPFFLVSLCPADLKRRKSSLKSFVSLQFCVLIFSRLMSSFLFFLSD